MTGVQTCALPISPSALVSTTTLTLSEQVQALLAEHAELWPALDAGTEPPPPFRPRDVAEGASVQRLRAALDAAGVVVPTLAADLGRTAALLAVLRYVGLRSPVQLQTVLTLAQLPCCIAEGAAQAPLRFGEYPMCTPELDYVDGQS